MDEMVAFGMARVAMSASRPRCVHVERADVAAAGFATAPPGEGLVRVVIERRVDGTWSVLDEHDLRELSATVRRQCRSLAVAVLAGANIVGPTVTALRILDEVCWVALGRIGVVRCRSRSTDPSES